MKKYLIPFYSFMLFINRTTFQPFDETQNDYKNIFELLYHVLYNIIIFIGMVLIINS